MILYYAKSLHDGHGVEKNKEKIVRYYENIEYKNMAMKLM